MTKKPQSKSWKLFYNTRTYLAPFINRGYSTVSKCTENNQTLIFYHSYTKYLSLVANKLANELSPGMVF